MGCNSFEHDALVEDESDRKESLPNSSDKVAEVAKKVKGSTVWNAKVILMSGIIENALAELISERIPEDKALHVHNVMRFAILCKDHTFFATGGSWDSVVDGGDPATDESALIQTAI
ncbi:hypothetical protein KI387_039511, partial [Taxus chinensis]